MAVIGGFESGIQFPAHTCPQLAKDVRNNGATGSADSVAEYGSLVLTNRFWPVSSL